MLKKTARTWTFVVTIFTAASAAAAPFENRCPIVTETRLTQELGARAASLTYSRLKSLPARFYARDAKEEHRRLMENVNAVVSRNAMTPIDSVQAQAIRARTEQELAQLGQLKGSALDRAYIEMTIADHEQTLARMDGRWLVNAETPDLRQFLYRLRATTVHYLDLLRKMRTAMAPEAEEAPDAPDAAVEPME